MMLGIRHLDETSGVTIVGLLFDKGRDRYRQRFESLEGLFDIFVGSLDDFMAIVFELKLW